MGAEAVGQLDGAQRRETGDRQGGRLLERNGVRQGRHHVDRYGGLFGPPTGADKSDDPRPDRWPGLIGGRLDHLASDVPTGPPARFGGLETTDLAPVE